MSEALAPDLGESTRAAMSAAGIDLSNDAPLVTPGMAQAAAPAEANQFEKALAAAENGEPIEPAKSAAAPPAEVPAPETPVETPRTETLEYLKTRYGMDLTGKYKSDDDLLQAHVNLTKKIGERDEYANLGRLAATEPHKLIELYRQRGVIPAEQPPEPKVEPKQEVTPTLAAPEWNEEWNRWIERGQLAADTPPQVLKEIKAYSEAKAFAKSPVIQKMAAELAELRALKTQPQQPTLDPQALQQQIIADVQGKQWAAQVLEKNAHWLFKPGTRDLTMEGQIWRDTLAHYDGRVEPDEAIRIADERIALNRLRSAVAAPPPAAPNKVATQRQPEPARPATDGEGFLGDPMRDGEDLGTAAKRRLKQLGISLHE